MNIVIREVGDDERLNLPLLVRESRERRETSVLLIMKMKGKYTLSLTPPWKYGGVYKA